MVASCAGGPLRVALPLLARGPMHDFALGVVRQVGRIQKARQLLGCDVEVVTW
jgi:hypothetical protein